MTPYITQECNHCQHQWLGLRKIHQQGNSICPKCYKKDSVEIQTVQEPKQEN